MFQTTAKTLRNGIWLALAASLSSAAYASTGILDCSEDADALRADAASHDANLTPRVEALIREAFDETTADSESLVQEPDEAAAVEESAVRAALPGVSEDDTRIYRRNMYRTDI